MSEIMMNVRDAGRALHGTRHGSRLDYLVAALSADPETIEELQAALARFLPAEESRTFFAGWHTGTCAEPWDAGLAVIDLAARLVVVQSSYSLPGRSGEVTMIDRHRDREVGVPYHVAEDWLFTYDVEGWESIADERRRARLASPPIDTRAVLHGRVCEFIARECWSDALDLSVTERAALHGAISGIHARWLETPRDDLGGKAPRDVLLERKDHIGWDMQDRSEQWSLLQECPPGLPPTSTAYRFGGFGTHEIVVYYDLVRFLICECWDHAVSRRSATAASAANSPQPTADALADEARRLEALRDEWLEAPNFEEFSGRPPASVIAHARARLPEGETGAAAVHDADCPCCQMLADLPGPFFWGLDGSHMDDEFAFSFHRTREEWEADRRKWEDFNRRFNEEQRTKPALVTGSIWRTSFVADNVMEQSPEIALFALASRLSELTQDLKDAGAAPSTLDALHRDFGNLRDSVQNPAADLIDPVTAKLCDTLMTLAESYPGLNEKCADLEEKLREFAGRQTGEWEDEELPF